MAGYSGTPLAGKLGIKPGSAVLLDGAPDSFGFGPQDGLPDGVRLVRRVGPGPYDVIVCFCTSAARLAARWSVLHPRTPPDGALWIAWPKRSAGVPTDLDEQVVRQFALSHRRVDTKVCAINETWSGLKHVIRTRDRPG